MMNVRFHAVLVILSIGILASCAGGFSGERVLHVQGSDSDPTIFVTKVSGGERHIIVVHGGPGISHDYLRPEWDLLRNTGNSIVYYDQRGCGESGDGAPYSWQADVADLHRVIKAVSVSEPVILAASSWGSTLSLLYTFSHPQRVSALILSGTPPWTSFRGTSGFAGNDEYAARADSLNKGLLVIDRAHYDSVDLENGTISGDQSIVKRLSRPRQLICRDAHLARVQMWRDVPLAEQLKSIAAPTEQLTDADSRTSSFCQFDRPLEAPATQRRGVQKELKSGKGVTLHLLWKMDREQHSTVTTFVAATASSNREDEA